MDFKLGQKVQWLECPGSIPVAAVTWIRGISPCKRYALLYWLRNPVPVDTLKAIDGEHSPYPTIGNHWANGIDIDTGDNLHEWQQEYEQRTMA